MKRSNLMTLLLQHGFVFVETMEQVVDIQEESIFEGILIDYVPVLRIEDDYAYKVFQLGGDE